MSLGITAVVSRWEQALLGVAFVVLSVFGLSRLARSTGWRKLLPSLTLFSSQVLWFLLPAALSLIKGLAVPQNRYSSGVFAVMHSAQYLWITSYYARREAAGEATNGAAEKRVRNWRPLAYFGVLVVGGIALFIPGPWLASRVFHHDFTTSFLIFTSLVNIHHFILDGAIWKLRDGRIASLLLDSRERISSAATEAGGQLEAVGRWLVGSSAGSRFLRVSAAVLLLVWGTVDQARYYLALHADNMRDLERAAALNSFDSSLQMRLGQRAFEDGHLQQAEAAWRRAMQANPADPAPRQALLRFLIHQNRFDEAFSLTEASLQYAPKDANLLFDHGLLALERGDAGQARADWNQAIAVDPGQANAHLYLAIELDREGSAQAAASHYNTYLEMIARQKGQDHPAPDKIIALVLRMADCQARASQADLAVKSYRLAEKLAAQTHQTKLESLADVSEAALEAKAGKLSEALPLYQQALQLDRTIGDDSATAEDWMAYGRFLDDAGFPPRLAYACLVKSQNIVQSLHGTGASDPMADIRKALEKRLRGESAAVRRELEPALAEALALRP